MAIENSATEEESLVTDQWSLINKTLVLYKVAAGGITITAVILAILIFFYATQSPVVVVEECGKKSFFESHREEPKITDDDVKDFVKNWVAARYSWSEVENDKAIRAVTPISTEGFTQKLREQFTKKKPPVSTGQTQKIEESIANIKVLLGEKDAVASFDRIVRINGIPIIIPSEVALEIVQGDSTQWNRLGLYVNGVIEEDEK